MFGKRDEGPGPTSKLLRAYSDRQLQENPDDPAHKGLGAKVALDRGLESDAESERQQFDLLFQGTTSFLAGQESIFEDEYEKLEMAWQRFQLALPKEQRTSLDGKLPDLKIVFSTVSEANKALLAKLSTKSGRAKEKFGKFCKQMDNYSNVFSIFPKDDKYVSLFSGALTTCVQAAIMHDDIRDQVEQTLDDLADDIEYWNKQQKEIGTKRMYKYFVQLFVIVFEFLTSLFEHWFRSRTERVKSSFNQNSTNNLFVAKRQRLDQLQAKLERELQYERFKTLEERVQDGFRDLQDQLKHIQTGISTANDSAAVAQKLNVISLLLGTDIQRLLDPMRLEQVSALPSPQPIEPSSQILSLQAIPASTGENVASSSGVADADDRRLASKSTLSNDVQRLKAVLAKELITLQAMIARITRLSIDASVRQYLMDWIGKASSGILWIQGPSDIPRPSQNTTTGVLLTAMTRQSNTRCIQYFCGLDYPARASSHQDQLMGLLHSLISQLIIIVAETQLAPLDFVQQHITAIIERTLEFEDAVRLIRPLRAVIPDTIIFIIDGIQALENRSDPEHTVCLLRTLGTLCKLTQESNSRVSSSTPTAKEQDCDNDGTEEGRIGSGLTTLTKICFTTDGYVDALGIGHSELLLDKIEYLHEADEKGCEETAEIAL